MECGIAVAVIIFLCASAGITVIFSGWIAYNKLDRFLRSYNIKAISKEAAIMTEIKLKEYLASIQMNLSSSWLIYTILANEDVISAGNTNIARFLFGKRIKQVVLITPHAK